MMKRSIFGKLLAIAMVFAGFSLTSCDENDNAIINGKVWVRPEVKLVDGGAIITGSSTADINRMLSRVRQEMINAAQNGKKFTIDIEGPVLDVTGSDNTISILTPTGGDLVVNFKSTITADTPLTIESKGVADDAGPTTSTNKVEINVPSASGIDLEINMPTTTVTLNAASGSLNIDELIAKTATNTLIIGKGVTVNWLQLKGGNAVVKDGGKVLGALMDNYFDVQKEGIRVDHVWKNEVPTTITDEDYFYVNKAKILKREDGDRVSFYIYPYPEDPGNEVEIIIADGARATVSSYWGNYCPAVNIIGEGDAKIIDRGSKGADEKVHSDRNIRLFAVKKLSNVTVDAASVLLLNEETGKYEEVELEEGIDDIDLALPQNAENCEIITIDRLTDPFRYYSDYIKEKTVSATFKNCKITFKSEETTGSISVWYPIQTDDRTSFKLIFDTCELNNFKFQTDFNGDSEDYDNYKSYIVLDNTKMDGKAITKDTELISVANNKQKWDEEAEEDVYVTATYYEIDGSTYEPVWNENKGKWVLMPVE